MRFPLATLLVPLLVLGTGCSSGSTDDSESSSKVSVGPIPKLKSVADKALPIDTYAVSDAQYHEINVALNKLQSSCVQDYGLDLDLKVPPVAPDTRMARRYMNADLDYAKTFGYHTDPAMEMNPDLYTPDLSKDQLTVLLGGEQQVTLKGPSQAAGEFNGKAIPPGGCLQKAKDQLLDRPSHAPGDDAVLVDKLDSQAYASMLKDERVAAVFADWSACMKEQGYDYATPAEANDDPKWQATETASTEEISAAVADVTCKLKHNVLGVQFAVESAYDKQLIEQNAEALAEVKALNNKRLKIAAKIFSGAR